MNIIILTGSLGKDAELQTFQNGDTILKIAVATNQNWFDKSKNEWQSKTTWHNVQQGGQYVGELSAKLLKGTKVAIEGMQKYREYEKDGVKHRIGFVDAKKIEIQQKVGEQQNNAPMNQQQQQQQQHTPVNAPAPPPVNPTQGATDYEDEVPF